MSNLERLSKAEQEMDTTKRHGFLNALIGAVSVQMSEQDFSSCIESALKVINREVR